MITQSFSLSDLGRRKNNEDFVAFFEPSDQAELQKSGCLYIVADGVGGAAKGERASQFAAQKLLYEYYQPENADLEPLDRLRMIMEHANAGIHSHASENHTRMATTMVVAVVRGDYLFVANVGDSRAYLIRDGAARQVNRDHSIVGELVEHGEMTEEEAMASKIKNRLTRSLGGDPEVTVDVYPPILLKVGDKILLCSDGLTRYATRNDVVRMTAQGKPEEIARRLVEFANQKGGADNISVITISFPLGGGLEPTLIVPRPKPVDMETLVTQPKVGLPRKRQPALAIVLLISVVGLIIVAGLAYKTILPMIIGPAAVDLNAVAAASASIIATNTVATINAAATNSTFTNTATVTSTPTPTNTVTTTNTAPSNASASSLTAVLNNCGDFLYVHKEAGRTKEFFRKEDGTPAFLRNGDIVEVVASGTGADASEYSNPYNITGVWLEIKYPPGTETRNWISKEDCVDVDLERLKNLPLIPLGQ